MSFNQLALVIPVYNEGENIRNTFAAIEEHLGTEPEILICYDFDEDTTLPAVRESAVRFPNLRLVKNAEKGVLGALKTGLRNVSRPAVLVTMADLSDDLNVVRLMLDEFEKGAAVVVGSRYMKGGSQVGGPWLKKMLARAAGMSLYYLAALSTHDATNNFRLYAKGFLDTVKIESTGGFELALELTVKAHRRGLKIKEVPTVWRDRTAGESRFRLMKWLPKYLRWYFFALGIGREHA